MKLDPSVPRGLLVKPDLPVRKGRLGKPGQLAHRVLSVKPDLSVRKVLPGKPGLKAQQAAC